MIRYRPFLNSDPPQLAALWNASGLGRGAVEIASPMVFETLVFSQPYFDPRGLIVACEGPEVVGFVHAGFGAKPSQSELDYTAGVICAVAVRPDYRRRGIGRELIARAEQYLQAAGAQSIEAGPAPPHDPFYVGLYGGSAPAGFLESDPAAAPFFAALGYEPARRINVYQCDLSTLKAPVSMRLISIRRKTELQIAAQPEPLTWWWSTRYGRLDALSFRLVSQAGGPPLAAVTVVGLDFYLPKWQVRAVGMAELFVPESERRQGYGQALLLAAVRRLEEELVTHVECHAPAENEAAVGLLESTGFAQVDTGVVYRRPEGGR